MKTVSDTAADELSGPVAVIHRALDELIDELGEAATGELAAARQAFDQRRGRVFEDEELWEPWTQAFLEWFALERVATDGDLPPAARALAAESDRDRAEVWRALSLSHRSLFEVRELVPGGVELRDILGGGWFRVDEGRALHGVSEGHVAEMRLVGYRRRVLFGKTFCYHPSGTSAAIARIARRIRDRGGDRREVMDYCAGLRIRALRYRHVSPQRVYESPPDDQHREGRG